ncbi:hypothetical protein Tco_0963209 [Tanacetum coccineum]
MRNVTPIPVTSPAETATSTGTKMTVPSTAEEKTCKKNDVKARSLLLMALAPMNIHLTSTASKVWMNKTDFDTMSLDDLYNNFKIVEQKVKKSAGASNDDKNLAFVTTTSNTNNINTVNPEVSTTTTKVNTASTEISTARFSDATVYAFLSTQPKGSKLVHEDLEQLHNDDLEEIDLKWNRHLAKHEGKGKFIRELEEKSSFDGKQYC